jgi:hypothetical protein
VRELLEERGRTTNGDVRALLDGVATLPPRTAERRPALLAAAAAVAILVIGGALAVARLSGTPAPTGPHVGAAAFAGDPRLAACGSGMPGVGQVFEMAHARDYRQYLPAWTAAIPELDVDDPALVVIGTPYAIGVIGGPQPAPSVRLPTVGPGHPLVVDVCIATGSGSDAILHRYVRRSTEPVVPVPSNTAAAPLGA